jgi:hypothetical protein
MGSNQDISQKYKLGEAKKWPTYTVKKVHEFPVSSRDVTNQTPPGQELFSYDVIIPAQGEFGSDIPAGDGKLANLFLRCTLAR